MELIAIAGTPNCGKTALFNALTGSRQKVANYPGVTVEKKEGVVECKNGTRFRIIDLPGTYSLDPKSPDEKVAFDYLFGAGKFDFAPHILIAVADATNLERSLSLVLELRQLGRPVVLALNMMDLAKQRNLALDLKVLERELGCPIVPTIAVKGEGIDDLVSQVASILGEKKQQPPSLLEYKKATGSQIRARFNEIDRILSQATMHVAEPDRVTEKLDAWVLHPLWGHVILAVALVVTFQAVFSWAAPFMDLIEAGVEGLSTLVGSFLSDGVVKSLLIDGIIAGVGSVIVFLPQILFLFLFILVLEDSGYLARAAFLMDRSMKKVGLHGRAFIPLLSSYACAIPGVMATRTIPSFRDRLATISIAPLMTCSARLPVYALLISAFIPSQTVLGVFNLQGLVMFGLYAVTIPLALVIALVLKKTTLQGQAPPFVMELPTYKVPSVKNVLLGLKERGMIFLKRAGKLIFVTSVLLWVLATYPSAPEGATQPAIQYSLAGKIGKSIEPVLKPAGFDWRIATGLLPGFAAREVMVGALGTVFAIENAEEQGGSELLSNQMTAVWGLPTALALLAWYIFSPQCLATFAVIRRETNSWKWTSFIFFYLLGLAYLAAMVTYQITSLL